MMHDRRSSPAEAAADRREQILKAAVEVFAERGFHRTRVSDIAKRAGVAYGLIYHYFESKDHVLNSVFEENWRLFLKVLREIEGDRERRAPDRLASIASLLIEALKITPSIIQVIIQEISRSDRFVLEEKVNAFEDAFAVVRSIIEQGQARGEFRASLDPRVGAYCFFGALETICTGFMLKSIKCSTKEEADRVKHTVTEIMLFGMCRDAGDRTREGR